MSDVAPNVEISVARDGDTTQFWRTHEREALRTFWDFTVIWHEQSHELVATRGGSIVGALRLRIAASLAHIDALVVDPANRRFGIGRALLTRAEELANYYNCHKMTVEAPNDVGDGLAFFTSCDYKVEAVLPQHTFKLDVAVLRKFLL